MTSLAARVLDAVQRRRLCDRGARVVAAVSGGADSVALAWLLRELSTAGALELAGLAHLDHSLRGAESARDAAFCRDLAAELDVPFDVEAADVKSLARSARQSIEEAGREARYGYLERARIRLSADVVATAHTRDDQAETVLLRLFRGAGTQGVAGILPRRGAVVRPLIDLRHRQLVSYLESYGRRWVEDATNEDRTFARNWVRHELLPGISARFGDRVVNNLARAADLAREDERLLGELSSNAAAGIQEVSGASIQLQVTKLLAQPAAIRQRLVRSALRAAGGPGTAAHVSTVLRLAREGAPARQQIGRLGLELSAAGRVLSIRGAQPSPVEPAAEAWSYPLAVPGSVQVPEANGRLTASESTVEALGGFGVIRASAPGRAVVAGVASPLTVRCWQSGDALQVLGLSGRKKKVQDLFVDRKVPRDRRSAVPVVAHPDGRIVWVAGHATSEVFRVTEATKSVVILSFEPFLEATK